MAGRQPLDGLRILVAEDNVLAAMELEQVLEECGCETVGPAATVEQALRLAREERLDGAVLDVNLRDQAVFPVADELARRGVRMIFATGYEDGYNFPARARGLHPVAQALRRAGAQAAHDGDLHADLAGRGSVPSARKLSAR